MPMLSHFFGLTALPALLAFQEEDYNTSQAHLALIEPESDELEDAVYLQTRIHQKLGMFC